MKEVVMRLNRLLVVLFVLAIAWAIAAPAAEAQVWDKKTTITAREPFEIPGRVLPAGTYVMRIVDAAGFRRVVRFYNADESRVLATVIGIPDYKLEASDNTEITFYESAAGVPRPLQAWFYPGSNFGVEFAYPKARAAAIAAVAEEHVPAIEAPAVAAAEPPIRELLEEPITVYQPGGEEVAVTEAHPEEPLKTAAVTTPALPRTATPLPLVALIGLLAAGAATGLRFRK
jgi:hypothetical protein